MTIIIARIVEWLRIVGKPMSWAGRIGPFHAWELAKEIHNPEDDAIRAILWNECREKKA